MKKEYENPDIRLRRYDLEDTIGAGVLSAVDPGGDGAEGDFGDL